MSTEVQDAKDSSTIKTTGLEPAIQKVGKNRRNRAESCSVPVIEEEEAAKEVEEVSEPVEEESKGGAASMARDIVAPKKELYEQSVAASGRGSEEIPREDIPLVGKRARVQPRRYGDQNRKKHCTGNRERVTIKLQEGILKKVMRNWHHPFIDIWKTQTNVMWKRLPIFIIIHHSHPPQVPELSSLIVCAPSRRHLPYQNLHKLVLVYGSMMKSQGF